MRSIVIGALLALAAAAALVGFEEARNGITAEEIRAHILFLSKDELKGRAPGTRGGDLAAEYIKAQFIRSGLEPVNGRYFEDVPLVGVTPDPSSISLAFETQDRRLEAVCPDEAMIWPGVTTPSVRLDTELVFVGYGIDAPRWDWDDYKGRDLTGKVAVFLVGEPPAPPDEPGLFDGRAMTYYGRWSYKFEEARRRGAAGALLIHMEEAAGYGWNVVRTSWAGEQLMLAEAGDGAPLQLEGWLTRDLARRVFEQAGLDLPELYVQAARRDFRPVDMATNVRSRMRSRSRKVEARNVVGYAPGTEGGEVVVFTSHYDHLGVGPAVEGDSIYNGAYDNASGVALLLEIAQAFSQLDGTRRGGLFIATTAEEAGLLGSRQYVREPLFPLDSTVAALNIDGANLWGETDDIIALGADRSTIGEVLAPRAAEMGLDVVADPEPEKGGFFRSDQFPFARAGVPVLYLRHGVRFRGRPEGWGSALMQRWSARNYHQPSDEYDPAFDLTGAVQQARLIFAVGYDLANGDETPHWLQDPPYPPRPGRPSP